MVIEANSTQSGTPNLVVKKEILFSANSSIVIQHCCENSTTVEKLGNVTAQLQSSIAVEQHCCPLDSSALVWFSPPCSAPLCSILLWWDLFNVSAPARETVFGGKRKCILWAGGWLTCIEVSVPWSLIGSSSYKWGLQILTVWLVQKALSWLVNGATD